MEQEQEKTVPDPAANDGAPGERKPEESSAEPENYDDPYAYYGDAPAAAAATEPAPAVPAPAPASPPPPPPAPAAKEEEEDGEEDGMLRMSFMEHLEELRSRIIRVVAGVGVAFLISIIFASNLWQVVSDPAVDALTRLGYENTKLTQIKPMETFTTVYVKLPLLTAVFLASPWVLYQIWAFIAPGLYKKERRWAAPFVICSAGLFILGGLFAYFVAFRFGLAFLLGIGRDINIAPYVSVTEYFDLFVNVTLGIGLVFELPILIFFLTLLRIVTPRFLMRNARYAVLLIVVLAAIVTPTPDVVNLMLFSVPMCLLYFVGVFAGYLLNLHRDDQRFPWKIVLLIVAALAMVATGTIYFAVTRYGYHFQTSWPFLVR